MSTPEERRAAFRVVRGTPSDAELGALTVVLAAVASAAAPAAPAPAVRDRWSDPEAQFRRPLHPGPGAWQAVAWPSR